MQWEIGLYGLMKFLSGGALTKEKGVQCGEF